MDAQSAGALIMERKGSCRTSNCTSLTEFEAFELGSPPGWVKPGEEANKIGYYRTFNGKLRFKKANGKTATIEVKTIISWDDGWFVTHLLPIKH